jgi:CRP/FNR family transcriptional regulator, cyclic AMP receptor protein
MARMLLRQCQVEASPSRYIVRRTRAFKVGPIGFFTVEPFAMVGRSIEFLCKSGMMVNQHWHIRNCSLFKNLDNSQLSQLEATARARSFPRGSVVYLPTDEAEGAFLLAEGRIRLSSTTPDGKLAILGYIEPGDLFGELGLLHAGCREERAEAMLPSNVILFSGRSLQLLMEQSGQLTLQVTKLIGMRLRRIERRLKSLLFRSNRDRICMLLLDLVEQYGKSTDHGIHIDIKLSHQDLASLIGATRESVTHIMGAMQLEGILKFGRQRIVVRDAKRLSEESQMGTIHQLGKRNGNSTVAQRLLVSGQSSESSQEILTTPDL